MQFHSYWNLSREIAEEHCGGGIPGHAQEYETAMALALMPEAIRRDAMEDDIGASDPSKLDASSTNPTHCRFQADLPDTPSGKKGPCTSYTHRG